MTQEMRSLVRLTVAPPWIRSPPSACKDNTEPPLEMWPTSCLGQGGHKGKKQFQSQQVGLANGRCLYMDQ